MKEKYLKHKRIPRKIYNRIKKQKAKYVTHCGGGKIDISSLAEFNCMSGMRSGRTDFALRLRRASEKIQIGELDSNEKIFIVK